ncbi:MAG: hypothetical protein IKB34_07720 [Clostridia bacterium]|nr:hypothetical protein [Clostridia bacterium]
MKINRKNRILALILALLMIVSVLPMSVYAQESDSVLSDEVPFTQASPEIYDDDGELLFPSTFMDVSTSAELEAALSDGIDAICITADFEIDRTFYITENTIVYSKEKVKLTRNANFAGDMFVVGQKVDNTLCEAGVIFSLGGYDDDGSSMLTIDGNKENMTVDVTGSVIFVCAGAQADLYNDFVATNCYKSGNERTLDTIHGFPTNNVSTIGGPVGIIAKDGCMNIYGGTYSHNSGTTDSSITTSAYGGAFYNYAVMNIYGGVFEGNSAVRAGVFYNYRTLFIYNATIKDNTASTAGGAIYAPTSSGAKTYLGGVSEYCESRVVFSGNTAATYGGAIYSTGRVTAQDTTFSGNSAETGGAIYVGGKYGPLSAQDCMFDNNTATSNGGAIASSGHNTLNITTDIMLANTVFSGNSALNGGAVYTEGSETTGYVVARLDKVKFISNEATNGAGIYMNGAADVVMNKIDAQQNAASGKGGVVYSTASTLSVYNSNIENNTATAGSAMYLYTSAVTGVYGTYFSGNACLESNTTNAGALFIYTGAVETIIHSCTFVDNLSYGLGGGIFVSNKSDLKLYNITAINNSASKGGFLYATTTGTLITISGMTVSGNTASVGGPIIWGNSAGAKLSINKANYIDLDIEEEYDGTYWSGAIYNKLTVTEINSGIPSYTDYNGDIVDGLWTAVLVKSQNELENALNEGAPLIKLINDITLNKTLFVKADTLIFSTTPVQIARADDYIGIMFSVGSEEVPVSLEFGNEGYATKNLITINGSGIENAESAISVNANATVTVYESATVSNNNCTAGVITVKESGQLILNCTITDNSSTQEKIINNLGTVEIIGGSYTNNTGSLVYNNGTLTVTDGEISSNTATTGAAIYNESILFVNGGVFDSNTAEAGGAIYITDGTVNIAGGTFTSNSATVGGAIYTVGGNSILGGVYQENTATNGGAIFIDVNSDTTVSNTSFISNNAENGGAIYTVCFNTAIDSSSFKDNEAVNGGAIYVSDSILSISNNVFTSNSAEYGGSIYLEHSSLDASGDTFTSSNATYGGAIYAHNSDITVEATTFESCYADLNGGAVSALDSDITINYSEFEACSADNSGGAIYVEDTSLFLRESKFTFNSAETNGGAISLGDGATAEIVSTLFQANSAETDGGAIYLFTNGAKTTTQNCSFKENSATGFGGAICVSGKSIIELCDTSATSNSALRGGFMHITDTNTEVVINGISVSNNTANNGPIVYGNDTGATVYVNKKTWIDAQTSNLDSAYFFSAFYGKLTVKYDLTNSPATENAGGLDLSSAVEVSSADELENAIAAKTKYIKIVSDFDIDRTYYITYGATIFSSAPHVITRSPDFGGEFFVVGETADGVNSMLAKGDASLTLGNPNSSIDNLLIIDGNKDNMTVDVHGSIIFVVNGARVHFYNNLTVRNCHKNNNEKTLDAKYRLSRPERIGGSLAIIVMGSVNVHGGTYTNNSVREQTSTDEEGRLSSIGGLFYNQSNLNIYDGLFRYNEAARGGIVYNYDIVKIYGGEFVANQALTSGGAVYYSPSSVSCYLNIGFESDKQIIFRDNIGTTSGGVICSSGESSIVIYGNCSFDNNTTVSGSGGAIYAGGTLILRNTTFSNNSSTQYGGAIYASKTFESDYGHSIVTIENCSFISNNATYGGAYTVFTDTDESLTSGAISNVFSSEFIANSASNGGAIYTNNMSSLSFSGCTFEENTASGEGGAMYVIGNATVKIKDSKINSNTASSYAGAISVRSARLELDNTTISNNASNTNAGAIYIAYSSAYGNNSTVIVNDSVLKGNSSLGSGGAIYATRRAIEGDTNVLNVRATDFSANYSNNHGGAVYLTGGVHVDMNDVTFVSNSTRLKSEISGGAIGVVAGSSLEINNGIFTRNNTYLGGGIYIGTDASVVLNDITASKNMATFGGFIYSKFGDTKIYNSDIKTGSAASGAGIYLYEGATAEFYNTNFKGNATRTDNGGALFIYTFGKEVKVQNCNFDGNVAANVGGAIYVSGESLAKFYNNTGTDNSAVNGGFMYVTKAGTVVDVIGLTVSGNTVESGGKVFWINTKNATVNFNKSTYSDLDYTEEITDEYWSTVIEGNLVAVVEIQDKAPSYTDYKETIESVVSTTHKNPVSVDEIFNLAENSQDGFISSKYDTFPVLDKSSNFMSREQTIFKNINGNDVTVDTYVYQNYRPEGNMNVGQGLMIFQSMLYKQANPEEEVYIDIASYRFSVDAAVNINRNSRYFGYMRQLTKDYDEFGFVRISYLLVCAAKMGIHVNVMAHEEAYPLTSKDRLEPYFTKHMSDPCDPEYVTDKLVADYLTFTKYDWDISGSEMMHVKLCAVSHYLDMHGNVHKNAVWTSSSNLDGIRDAGYNANWKLQTATIISDHEQIYRVATNYLRLMPLYEEKDHIIEFQNIINVRSTKQIDLILAGRGDEIPEDEQIVYIGTKDDNVFEFYFTPFAGDILSWNETYNPYCKYLRELYDSEDYIVFTFNAAEYSGKFPLGTQIEQMIIDAFHNNKNPNNKIYANMESFDATTFDDLVVGVDIGFKSINKWELGEVHNKDLQFSYVKNGQRYYVSLLNSCNFHSGSMYFQPNFALVIKETTCASNSIFSTIGKYSTTTDVVTHTYGDEIRKEATETEHGMIYRECTCCKEQKVITTLHYSSDWIVEKVATPIENGIRYKECVVCHKLLESEETKHTVEGMNPDNNTGLGFINNAPIPVTIQKTPVTIEATVQYNKNGRGGIIFGNYSSYYDDDAINLEIFTEGRVRLFYITNGIRTDILFNTDIRSKTPVHIAVTVDGSTVNLYVDGVLAETVDVYNPLPDVHDGFVIGGDNREGNSQKFRGTIYSVSVFSDVRSADEIKADKEYISGNSEDLLISKYFTSNNAHEYVTDNTLSGTKFNSTTVHGIGKLNSAFATIEALIQLPTAYDGRGGVILSNYTESYSDTISLEILQEGKLRLFYIANGTKYDYSFTTDVRSDEPTHITVTLDGTVASLYVNGVFVESITLAVPVPSVTEGFAIGGDYRQNNAQYFKGTIYSVQLFSNIRTSEEIVNDIIHGSKDDEALVYSAYYTSSGVENEFKGQSFNEKLYGGLICNLNGTPHTFEVVIQLSPDCNGRGGIILSNNFKSKPIVSFEVFKEGKLRLYYVNGTETVDCKFDTDVRSDTPIHVALSVDGTIASLYINGKLTEVKELALPLPESTYGYHIGGDFRKNNTEYFKGTIYSVNLFDNARSEEEIKQDMVFVNKDNALASVNYINPKDIDISNLHKVGKFEVITDTTPTTDGTAKVVCDECGRVLGYYNIPYMSNGIIKNDYLNTGSALTEKDYYKINSTFDRNPKTFEILLKLSPGITERAGVILGNYNGSASERMNLEIYTKGNPRLWYKVNNVSYSYLFNTDVRSDEAVHLTFTIDGLSCSLYIDGVLYETIALDCEVPFDGSNFYIGTDARINAQSFKGEIYSASIFSDIRTADEIKRDMIMITSDTDNVLFSKYFVANEAVAVKGPWTDKTAIFVGDSITAGTNCDDRKYWELLKDYLELGSSDGLGIAGSCISSTSDYGIEHDPLINRYDEIPEADLITVFMGTNDYGHDTPLGTIDDTTDTSFYGALNVIIPALQAKYPNSKLVFITPLHRYGFGTNSATGEAHTFDYIPNGAGHTLEEYVNAILDVCEKYSVSVIDLYSNLDLDASLLETREYYMEDGLHPNSAGHRLIAEYVAHSLMEMSKDS